MNKIKLKQIYKIINEIEHHNGLIQWMQELEPFRNKFNKYRKELQGKSFHGDHQEDHHAQGYYAPLGNKSIGFDNIIRTPSEQIICLSNQFKEHGIRFIYIALPCKAAVLTSMYVDSEYIPDDFIVTPQWRKMLLEIMLAGVECVDMLPIFLKHAFGKRPLYGESHMWAPYAAELTAREVAASLSNFKGTINIKRKRCSVQYTFPWFSTPRSWVINGVYKNDDGNPIPYESGSCKHSEIIVFGNCNLQEFVRWEKIGLQEACPYPADFCSQLAFELQNDVLRGGRHLPFSSNPDWDMGSIPPNTFLGKKCAVYLGFPSASYVRLFENDLHWSIPRIPENAFGINFDVKMERKSIAIWGTGGRYKDIVKPFLEYKGIYKNIEYFIEDNINSKRYFEGKPVYTPEEASVYMVDNIIVASCFHDEIKQKAKKVKLDNLFFV